LKHISGTKIEKVNRLSRKPDWKVEVENNNNNQILIKKQWIYSLTEVVIKEPEVEILKKRWMTNRRIFGIERRKDVCAKRQRVENRDNPVTS